tara:strand:- start:266 stop:424 length:159 start_codon:yes stop_codon:yes gene_type:complete
MTHDQTETKFWYNGEYQKLDKATVSQKLDQHDTHCPFFTDVGDMISKDLHTT